MALVRNYSIYNGNASRNWGGTYSTMRSNFQKPSFYSNRFTHFDKFNGTPWGYLAPYSWALPRIGGGAATNSLLNGTLSENINGNMGVNGEASITSLLDVQAALGLIVNGVSNIALSGALSANVQGALFAIANLVGSGQISSAALGALANAVGALTGTLSNSASLTGKGSMSVDITPFTTLSPENMAKASATEILDTQLVEIGMTVRQALKLILAANAGKVSGAGGSTITIRNTADTKDRIIAAVDANGNRTGVTIDVS